MRSRLKAHFSLDQMSTTLEDLVETAILLDYNEWDVVGSWCCSYGCSYAGYAKKKHILIWKNTQFPGALLRLSKKKTPRGLRFCSQFAGSAVGEMALGKDAPDTDGAPEVGHSPPSSKPDHVAELFLHIFFFPLV